MKTKRKKPLKLSLGEEVEETGVCCQHQRFAGLQKSFVVSINLAPTTCRHRGLLLEYHSFKPINTEMFFFNTVGNYTFEHSQT